MNDTRTPSLRELKDRVAEHLTKELNVNSLMILYGHFGAFTTELFVDIREEQESTPRFVYLRIDPNTNEILERREAD